ncbi:hypothetical protein [Nibricoccus sp. IMCC34717]|uniref:hypothetical protein n=1 Tax=Nibricoccus sp. IMCC34717 TaxID=3034021 RepID=UPI00384B5A08
MSLAKRESRANLVSWISSLFFAAVGVSVGGGLALFSLVAKPVEVLKKLPDDAASRGTFYVPGERDATRGKLWSLKRRTLLQGQSGVVSLSEEELNSWFASVARTDTPRDPKAPPPTWVLDGLNFRVTEGMLQVGLPITFNGLSEPMKIIVQSRGQVVPGAGRWYYRPTEFWVGSLPLHRLPGAIEYVVTRELDEAWVPAEALEAWKRVAEVSVGDKVVQVRMQ